MAKFTVRVELHEASSSVYERLHQLMSDQGFAREVASGDGILYRLPDAEYGFEGEVTAKDVIERAKRAAEGTGREFRLLVTESKGRTWYGLEKVG